jgi:FMN phosphatase YigB (HAD superfamily)
MTATDDHVQTVLFDLGGVLACDPWQSLLLTPGRGLADRLGLKRAEVERVGEALWSSFSIRTSREEVYWAELAELLRIDLPSPFIAELEDELLYANPVAPELLGQIRERGILIGVISDNTSFWFPKQAALVTLDHFVERDRVFVSYKLGMRKRDTPGLFEIAAQQVDKRTTLVVDDRTSNIDHAGLCGFRTLRYSMQDPDTSITVAQVIGG